MKPLFIIPMTLILAVIFQPLAPASECTKPIDCVKVAPNEPLRIGVLRDKSGKAASAGTDQIRAIEIALANRGEQLLGHPVELQVKDSQCAHEGGKVAAMELVSDTQIVALFGTTCSQSGVIASKIMSAVGLVMISGSNSAASLTSVGGKQGTDWQSGYFRTFPNDYQGAQETAQFVFQKLGITKVATINDGDKFTRGYTERFGKVFTKLRGKIVLDETVNKGDTDMHPVLKAVVNHRAELIFFPLFETEGKSIVRQVKEVIGLENIILMGNFSLLTENFIQSIGEDGKGMYFMSYAPLPESTIHQKFLTDYHARYSELPKTSFLYASYYDAVNILLDAIEKITEKNEDGTLYIRRQDLRKALYDTTDFEGMSGKLTCDRFGDCGAARINIVRLDDPTAGVKGVKSNVIYSPLN